MENAKCAHMTVVYVTRDTEKGGTFGWWECRDCPCIFLPQAATEQQIDDLQRQLAEAKAELARALEVMRPFARRYEMMLKYDEKWAERTAVPFMPEFGALQVKNEDGTNWINSDHLKLAHAILSSPGAEAAMKWLEEREQKAYEEGRAYGYNAAVGGPSE